jgi:CRISPR-associated helicase Cas3/CRISPR-associated endonuclease Cas3-HD
MYQIYYAKSPDMDGFQETNQSHLLKTSHLAQQFGAEIHKADEARLCGLLHDFGKYSQRFQNVLKGTASGVDHAIGGAAFLYGLSRNKATFCAAVEAIYGHHDGLVSFTQLKSDLQDSLAGPVSCHSGKEAALSGKAEYTQAMQAFARDFPDFTLPSLPDVSPEGPVETMLHTRLLFSCLVDADYSASAGILERDAHLLHPEFLLKRLEAYRQQIQAESKSDPELNQLRTQVYDRCGTAGEENLPGIFTLTAPTGTGKTLALLYFALRHCIRYHKRRIILVLPFLTLTEQSEDTYQNIVPEILSDHSQSKLDEAGRELAARWDAPFIITTSVKFFESLFARRSTDCRKLHSIADSVILFDEAQSLPSHLIRATLQAVQTLCKDYGCSMVFSTATQPAFEVLPESNWHPAEILPDHPQLYQKLRRTEVTWRLDAPVPLSIIAEEMSHQESVCVVVNLRRHARSLYEALRLLGTEDSVFYLTTDLCPAHRSKVIETIKKRLEDKLPCRVVSTQCIEAGVDLDFAVMYRTLAPLESIIQAAGRCNRNGSLPQLGQVIIFKPEDSGKLYPGEWYRKGAAVLENMLANGTIDIHDPRHIGEYYTRLFRHLEDHPPLIKGLKAKDYAQVEESYRLIDKQGSQVVVPYAGEEELYRKVSSRLRTESITAELMRQAAPITVSAFDEAMLQLHGEPLFFPRRRHSVEASRYYLLLTGHENCYTSDMGLQFQEMKPEDYLL